MSTLHSLQESVAGHLDGGRPERAWDSASSAFADGPPRTRHHARLLLHHLAGRLPRGACTPERMRLARSLGVSLGAPGRRPGSADFPVVSADHACFVTVHVEVLPEAMADRIDAPDPATGSVVKLALDAVRAQLTVSDRYTLTFSRSGWSGSSCGLAVALAAWSASQGTALPADLCASGAVDRRGGVADVGHAAAKAALRREARPLDRMLTPPSWPLWHPSLVPVESLDAAVRHAAIPTADDVEVGLSRLRRLEQSGEWETASALAARLVRAPGLWDEERLRLLLAQLTAANHAGDGEEAARVTEQIGQLDLEGADGEVVGRIVASQVVAAVDRLDSAAAHAALSPIAGWHLGPKARLHLRGAQALLAVLDGDLDRAESLRRRNLEVARPDEWPRCAGDLADVLGRVGRRDEALALVREALERVDQVRRRPGYQRRTRPYLVLHACRLLRGRGDLAAADALAATVREPADRDPGFRLALDSAVARGDQRAVDAVARGLPDWMAGSAVVGALVACARAQVGVTEDLSEIPPGMGLEPQVIRARLPY